VRGFICLVGPIGMPEEIVQKLSDMMVEGGKTRPSRRSSTPSASTRARAIAPTSRK
jgi:hypothetical protein